MTPKKINEARIELGLSYANFADALGYRSAERGNLRGMGFDICTGRRGIGPAKVEALQDLLSKKEE